MLLPVDTILYFEYIKAKKKVKIVTENMVYEYPDAISTHSCLDSVPALHHNIHEDQVKAVIRL